MSEWKEFSLKDITELVIDYRGKTPLKLGGEWSNHGYRALSAKNVKTGIIVAEESIRYVNEDLYKKWMKDEVQKGDILITSEAPFGEVFFWNTDEKIVLSQRLFDVRIKKDVCPQYVYYYMTSYPFQAELRSRASGTTVLGLKQPELLKTKVILPNYETQVKIAGQLSEIDSKIENNRKICANLEAQAQALFKHWFIDFAPFKDGKFVESELGMIPEGWRVGKLGDVTEFLNGFAFKSSSFVSKGKYKVITIKAVQDGKLITDSADEIEDLSLNIPSHCVLKIGDILLSLTGNVGRVCIVTQDNLVLNQRVCILNPRNLIDRGYVYTLSRTKLLKTRMINIAKGTAQANLSPVETSKLSIVVPPRYILDKFGIIANEYMSEIISAYQENQRLSTLRDTLLPKLMSGEIKV